MKLNGELVEQEIKKLGITKKEFCKRAGIKNYNLSKYISGANVPRNVVFTIADTLGLDMFEIVNYRGFNY